MPQNPLLTPSPLPHHVPPFDVIREEHFLPAVEAAIAEARHNIDAIKNIKTAPDFDNTIVALANAGETLGIVTGIFYNQLSANGTDGLQEIAEKMGPMTANFSSDVSLDPVLFAHVKTVYDRKKNLALTPEQDMLLDETYKGFVRNGALLDAGGQKRLREIDERLSVMAPIFANNIKKSMEAFTLVLTTPDDIKGLPESVLMAAKMEAEDRNQKDSWVFTLDAPSYGPFVSYSPRRDLREKMWRAYNNRAYGDAWDNCANILDIIRLKSERAKLLGYDNHAHYVLERRMAETPAAVESFVKELIAVYRPAAEQDLASLKPLAQADGIDNIMPWDVPYYSEKLKEQLYRFNTEDLRPYFPLEKVLAGTFEHFSKLFGIRFTANKTYPVWHPDVVAYDVADQKDGRFMGVLYADFYPRTGKKPGAWMTNYREQGLYQGQIDRPLVSIVCNFTKPTKEQPSLITHDEVSTLFHEMGHAMHSMLAEGTYPSLCGTNVLWDFVELPSQVQENWTFEKETLALISGHYQTGAAIPDELVEKLRASRNFMTGWMGLRQMAFSLLDLEWYTADPATIKDVAQFEDSILGPITLFPRLAGPFSPAFSHIFDGGYSAGYYSYKWAEVLDADAFEFFLENNLYDQKIAQKYRDEILSKGGSEHPATLYRRFRGRDADPAALLRREGLKKGGKAA